MTAYGYFMKKYYLKIIIILKVLTKMLTLFYLKIKFSYKCYPPLAS